MQGLRLLPAHDTILTPPKQRRENIGSLSKKALSNSVPELSVTQILLDMNSFLLQMWAEKNFLGKKNTQLNTHGFGNSSSWSSQSCTLLETERCCSFQWGNNFVRSFHHLHSSKRKGYLRREAQISRCTNTAARGSLQPKRDKSLKPLGICTKVRALVASHLNDPLMVMIMVHYLRNRALCFGTASDILSP